MPLVTFDDLKKRGGSMGSSRKKAYTVFSPSKKSASSPQKSNSSRTVHKPTVNSPQRYQLGDPRGPPTVAAAPKEDDPVYDDQRDDDNDDDGDEEDQLEYADLPLDPEELEDFLDEEEQEEEMVKGVPRRADIEGPTERDSDEDEPDPEVRRAKKARKEEKKVEEIGLTEVWLTQKEDHATKAQAIANRIYRESRHKKEWGQQEVEDSGEMQLPGTFDEKIDANLNEKFWTVKDLDDGKSPEKKSARTKRLEAKTEKTLGATVGPIKEQSSGDDKPKALPPAETRFQYLMRTLNQQNAK